jgi:hypothetical protein
LVVATFREQLPFALACELTDAGEKAELADSKVSFYWFQIQFLHYKFIFDLMLFDLVHGYSEHFADAFAVEYLESRELETGKSPGVASPEEDVDSGGNIETAADVKGDLSVSENLFA